MKAAISLRIICLLVALLGLPMEASAWHKTYSNPKVPNMVYRLDLCYTWNKDCGKKTADKFCSLKKPGAFALGFTIDHDIGASTATRTLGSGQVCGKSFCDGFKSIACVTGDGILYNYPNPSHGGMRLDWCLSTGKNCGRPAALAFCQKYAPKKYQFLPKVRAWWEDSDIGAQTPTKTISGNAVCNKSFCDGFSGIVCATK
jgi:hypothetical protein